jgi:hypothetical protein
MCAETTHHTGMVEQLNEMCKNLAITYNAILQQGFWYKCLHGFDSLTFRYNVDRTPFRTVPSIFLPITSPFPLSLLMTSVMTVPFGMYVLLWAAYMGCQSHGLHT